MLHLVPMKNILSHPMLLLALSLSLQVYGQDSKGDVVYAGRNFTWGTNMGSFDIAILLRENGTFCENLDAPDWQTKIEGRHQKIKDGILLEYMDKTMENDTIFIEKDDSDGYEHITYGGAQMLKLKTPNTVPEGYYEYKSASSSGGMGTGRVYVGTQRYDGIHFYANGTFNRSSSGGVLVSDATIGGGSSSDNSASGSYTIDAGLLTLTNKNGNVDKNSFFYSEPDEDGAFTIAMNGALFFSGDLETRASETRISNTNNTSTGIRIPEVGIDENNILEKIKLAHGGSAIDSINRVETVIETSGIEFKVRIDLNRKFLRLESLSPNFPYIEQLEDETGWVYQNGTIEDLTDTRIAEIQNTFYSGLFLLRTSILNRIKILDVKDNGKGFTVLKLDLDGTISGMIIDTANNRLIGTAKFNALGNEITYLSDYRMVDGVLIAFREEVETDKQDTLIQNTSYTINPSWDLNVWKRPN